MRNLRDVLVNDYGLELDNWVLAEATAISDDGTVIVGNGFNPSGNYEAWIVDLTATIPEPTTYSLALAATLFYCCRRRR